MYPVVGAPAKADREPLSHQLEDKPPQPEASEITQDIKAKFVWRTWELYAIIIRQSEGAIMSAATQVLSVRVSPSERELLSMAAENERTNLSDFIRRKAVEAAEVELTERRLVTIPAADWEKFEAWVDQPAKDVPALRDLAAHRPAWQD